MKNVRKNLVYCLLMLCVVGLFGCGKKGVDARALAEKTQEEINADIEKMNVEQLKSMVLKYKAAIDSMQSEFDKHEAELNKLSPAEKSGEKGRELAKKGQELGMIEVRLNRRFHIYYDAVKEKGGDMDLEVLNK
jgi:hypothetical protein